MERIFVIFDNGEVTKVDSLQDAGELGFFLVQEISGESVKWYDKAELTKLLTEAA